MVVISTTCNHIVKFYMQQGKSVKSFVKLSPLFQNSVWIFGFAGLIYSVALVFFTKKVNCVLDSMECIALKYHTSIF